MPVLVLAVVIYLLLDYPIEFFDEGLDFVALSENRLEMRMVELFLHEVLAPFLEFLSDFQARAAL